MHSPCRKLTFSFLVFSQSKKFSLMYSLLEEAGQVVTGNLGTLGVGAALLLLYVCLILGRVNLVEQRVALSMAGMLVVVMAVVRRLKSVAGQ